MVSIEFSAARHVRSEFLRDACPLCDSCNVAVCGPRVQEIGCPRSAAILLRAFRLDHQGTSDCVLSLILQGHGYHTTSISSVSTGGGGSVEHGAVCPMSGGDDTAHSYRRTSSSSLDRTCLILRDLARPHLLLASCFHGLRTLSYLLQVEF